MRTTVRVLYDEHRSLAAVLHGLLALVRACKDPNVRPELEVLRAMIYYIDAFPERMHHPKEDDFLFSRLAARSPEAIPLIQELRAEHLAGARMIRELEAALLAFEVSGRPKLQAFADAAEAYARFHWDHMTKEEKTLLPLAERHLTESDWRQIDDAFAGNEDPIADLRSKDFENLYSRIVSLAPEPVGLGQPWKKSGS